MEIRKSYSSPLCPIPNPPLQELVVKYLAARGQIDFENRIL